MPSIDKTWSVLKPQLLNKDEKRCAQWRSIHRRNGVCVILQDDCYNLEVMFGPWRMRSLSMMRNISILFIVGRKGLEPIPAGTGREVGNTLNRSSACHRADTQRHTHEKWQSSGQKNKIPGKVDHIHSVLPRAASDVPTSCPEKKLYLKDKAQLVSCCCFRSGRGCVMRRDNIHDNKVSFKCRWNIKGLHFWDGPYFSLSVCS